MNNIEQIFKHYKKCKLWISNTDSIKKINENFINRNIEEIKKFIDVIDNVLDLMSKDYSNLLCMYYLDNKTKEDFYYSKSTFYSKLKKASNEFMCYIGYQGYDFV